MTLGMASRVACPSSSRMFSAQASGAGSPLYTTFDKSLRAHDMAPFLRRKLVCFYCGQASTQRQDGTVRQWLCKNCDAVNYLDDSGAHTHPPAFDGTSNARYARPIPRPASPEVAPPLQSPYCDTCLKNQLFRKEALSTYLPDDLQEEDPEYQAFEARYPEYLKELDQRYPQVCAECEPEVRDIISRRHNFVKADNLRRNMDRSKSSLHGWRNRSGWREFLVLAGALCYWTSITLQLIWNLTGAMAVENPVKGMTDNHSSHLLLQCFWEAVEQRQVHVNCPSKAAPMAGWGLVLGLVSLWWNPQLNKKLYWRRARMAGLSDYYKLQVIAIVARFVGWVFLQDAESYGAKASFHWAIHLVMCVLTAVTAFKSYRLVKIDTTPQISWKESLESLLSKPSRQGISQQGSPPSYHQPVSRPSYVFNPTPQRFPLQKITSLQPEQPATYTPLTPPAEVEYEDMMEWSPSQPQQTISISQDSRLYQQSRNSHSGSIDASGGLPNERMKGLNRPIQLTGEPASPSLQGHSSEPRSYIPLAPPKFSQQEDTGLESILSDFLKLGPEPGQMSRPPKSTSSSDPSLPPPSKSVSEHVFGVILLGLCSLAWHNGYFASQIRLASLGNTAVFSGSSLFKTLRNPGPYRSYSNMLIFFTELLASFLLGQDHTEMGTTFGKVLLSIMVAQEVVQLIDSVTPSRSLSTPQQQSSTSLSPSTTNANHPNPAPSAYQSQSQPPPPLTSSFDSLTFGGPARPFSSPKLFPSLSIGSKPPSSSTYFNPINPPPITSNPFPAGADRRRLLGGGRKKTGWGGRRDDDSDSEYGAWPR